MKTYVVYSQSFMDSNSGCVCLLGVYFDKQTAVERVADYDAEWAEPYHQLATASMIELDPNETGMDCDELLISIDGRD